MISNRSKAAANDFKPPKGLMYKFAIYLSCLLLCLFQFSLQNLNTLLVLAIILALEILIGVIIRKLHLYVRGNSLFVYIISIMCEILLGCEFYCRTITERNNTLNNSLSISICSYNSCCSKFFES